MNRKRTSSEGVPKKSKSTVNSSINFYPSMLKGNTAHCSQNFDWNEVEDVILHDGTKYIFSQEEFKTVSISFYSQTVNIDDRIEILCKTTPCNSLTVRNFAAKAIEIIRLCGKLDIGEPTTQFQRAGTGNCSSSESGGETIPDPPIDPPFNAEEWRIITEKFLSVHHRYKHAKECNFENAVAKAFFASLMKLICSLSEGM